jgi:hypothetical protein
MAKLILSGKHITFLVKYEALTVVLMNIQVFCDVTRRIVASSKCQELVTQWHNIIPQETWILI